jgi:hypothetical protein
MSHPNPSYDPEDLTQDEIERLADRADLMHDAKVEDEMIRQRDIYDTIVLLKHARNDDLKEIALGLTNEVKQRFARYLGCQDCKEPDDYTGAGDPLDNDR